MEKFKPITLKKLPKLVDKFLSSIGNQRSDITYLFFVLLHAGAAKVNV